MEPIDFARRYLGEFKQHGNEIIPTYCIFCHGGEHRDKFSFALNVEKHTYNCKRGSCGKQGHFSQLCKEFGESYTDGNYEMRKPLKKSFKKPTSIVDPAKKKVEDYLQLRGFTKPTWERRGVGEVNGAIAFPYYMDGELVLMKFRKPEKYDGNGQKAWREDGGQSVLWGMDLCTLDKPLVIVEGEFDALALDEAGVPNVVSVPNGAQDLTWIENCWEWLDKFGKVIIWGDNDDPGRQMVRNIIPKIGAWKCFVVDAPHKDANVSLAKEGKDKTAKYVRNAKGIPVNGLLDLADVVPIDLTNVERACSGIPEIAHSIGDFLMGEVSVWTGRSGQGKSTFLGQMMIEAVNEGKSVCAYSGELRADRFQYWINLQAAGRKNIEFFFDRVKDKKVGFLQKEISNRIKEWYRGKFWLYDNNINAENSEETGIIKLFTYAARKYDCKVFLIDNLMTSKFDSGKLDSDYYRAQSNFVGELIHFAQTHNVHVHLVAHPKKTNKAIIGKDDVSGTGDITNRADNAFSVERVKDPSLGCDTIIKILKNRSEGIENLEIGLSFDPDSKRFWQPSDPVGYLKKYGWEEIAEREAEIVELCPWDVKG